MDSSSDSENEIINLGLMAKDYENGEELLQTHDGRCIKVIHISSKNSEHVIYGDNNKGKIVGVEKIGTNPSTSTENVLLIDGLKHNLLSIYQLCEKDILISFDSHIFQQVVTFSTILIHYKLLNAFLLSLHDLFLMLIKGER